MNSHCLMTHDSLPTILCVVADSIIRVCYYFMSDWLESMWFSFFQMWFDKRDVLLVHSQNWLSVTGFCQYALLVSFTFKICFRWTIISFQKVCRIIFFSNQSKYKVIRYIKALLQIACMDHSVTYISLVSIHRRCMLLFLLIILFTNFRVEYSPLVSW